jgi:hypothetical protein
MTSRITRPTLANLWRVLLTLLENQGAEDAPGLARSLAIAALSGRSAEAWSVRVEPRCGYVLINAPDPDGVSDFPDAREDVAACVQAPGRRRALTAH